MFDTPDQTQNPAPAEATPVAPDPSTEPASSTSMVVSVGDLAIQGDGVQIEIHGIRTDENGQYIMTGAGIWIPVTDFGEFRSQS